jgi:hypothetical protein
MTDALQSLEDQYILLTNNLSNLEAACRPGTDDMSNLMTQYVASRRNYFNCINQMFHDDDPAVQDLVAQMSAQQAALKVAVTGIGDIAGVITAITTAVQVGAQLAAKV